MSLNNYFVATTSKVKNNCRATALEVNVSGRKPVCPTSSRARESTSLGVRAAACRETVNQPPSFSAGLELFFFPLSFSVSVQRLHTVVLLLQHLTRPLFLFGVFKHSQSHSGYGVSCVVHSESCCQGIRRE